jgi:hypothetical protein
MANIASTAPSPARLDSAITSMTRQQLMPRPTSPRQHHHQHDSGRNIMPRLMLPRQHHFQHDLVAHHGQVALVVPHQHDSTVTLCHCQHWLGSVVTSMTQGLGAYFPNQQSCSEVHHQALGLRECHYNRQLDSGTLLPTSPILNRGERVVTNKIMGHFIEPPKSYL